MSFTIRPFAANYTLGRLYAADRRRINEAVDLLIKANRLRSERPEPLVLLCNLHPAGKKGSYLAALSRMPAYANAPEVAFESCMNQIYNGNYQGVDAVFIRLFNNYPDHPELTSALGGYFDFRRKTSKTQTEAFKRLAQTASKRYLAFPEERRTAARTARATKRLAGLK